MSPSPSPGWEYYTRGNYATLPTTDNDLETNFIAQDYIDVNDANDVRVNQQALGEYAIFQFKDYVGSTSSFNVIWEGQSNIPTSTSKVVLQIYDHDGNTWEDLDEENGVGANTDFQLTATVNSDLDHRVLNGVVSCRVYQLAM